MAHYFECRVEPRKRGPEILDAFSSTERADRSYLLKGMAGMAGTQPSTQLSMPSTSQCLPQTCTKVRYVWYCVTQGTFCMQDALPYTTGSDHHAFATESSDQSFAWTSKLPVFCLSGLAYCVYLCDTIIHEVPQDFDTSISHPVSHEQEGRQDPAKISDASKSNGCHASVSAKLRWRIWH